MGWQPTERSPSLAPGPLIFIAGCLTAVTTSPPSPEFVATIARRRITSTDDQRDDARAERPRASGMQVRENLEPTCHVTSGVLSVLSVRRVHPCGQTPHYHPCCTLAAGRRCPACTQSTLSVALFSCSTFTPLHPLHRMEAALRAWACLPARCATPQL